jgi:tRNA 2-thiouridine synthesizing protein A
MRHYQVRSSHNVYQTIIVSISSLYEGENTMVTMTNITTDDLTSIQAAKVVDARAMSCPGPLLEAKKGIGTVKVGDVLEIWSGEAATKKDLAVWCAKMGHDFLGSVPVDGYDRLFILRKK